MSKFVLTAQLQLQAPKNTQQIVTQIQNQLNNVNVQVNAKTAKQAAKNIDTLAKNTKKAGDAATAMGRSFAVSFKRFAAFSIATRAVGLFTRGLSDAVSEALNFERELIKVAQVTGTAVKDLGALTNEISKLATGLGVSSQKLLEVSRVLAQAGFSATEAKVALEALAKSALAATFDDITQTAEGAIAIFNQFGQGAGALEAQLGAINAVAGQFAVEAGDLIAVIRRTGGVFKAAGGDLNELVALFTSVRATTRESAESIATGLRTIFTRIQRPTTIKYLQDLGISLTDNEGKFVGAYEAIRRLSEAMSTIEAGDLKFIEIAEQLGGFRQIGKIIPLLTQFGVSQEALQAAMAGTNSLTEDAATAQGSLLVRLTALKEEFNELVRSLTASPVFKFMAESAMNLASALINVASILKDILPIITAIGAVKLFGGLSSFAAGFGGGLKGGGGPRAFATGGMVPGTGNRDTVPAMLTPGEFVIRKSSVNKIGAGRLSSMNAKGYALGGKVPFAQAGAAGIMVSDIIPLSKGKTSVSLKDVFAQKPSSGSPVGAHSLSDKAKAISQGALNSAAVIDAGEAELKTAMGGDALKFKTAFEGVGPDENKAFEKSIQAGVTAGVETGAQAFAEAINVPGQKPKFKPSQGYYDAINEGFKGTMFEEMINSLGGKPLSSAGDSTAPFDFQEGVPKSLAGVYGGLANGYAYLDAKIRAYRKSGAGKGKKKTSGVENKEFMKKARGQLMQESYAQVVQAMENEKANQKPNKKAANAAKDALFFGGPIRGYARGGSVTDTVPAMLTPGEFVINKKAASNIGAANLNRMNKKGVTGFATGGPVGRVQNFALGGGVAAGVSMAVLPMLIDMFKEMFPAVQEFKEEFDFLVDALKLGLVTYIVLGKSQKFFAKQVQGYGNNVKTAIAADKKKAAEGLQSAKADALKTKEARRAANAQQNSSKTSRTLTEAELKLTQSVAKSAESMMKLNGVTATMSNTNKTTQQAIKALKPEYNSLRSTMKTALNPQDFKIFKNAMRDSSSNIKNNAMTMKSNTVFMKNFALALKQGMSVEKASAQATKQTILGEKQKVGILKMAGNGLKTFANKLHKAGAGLDRMVNGGVMAFQMMADAAAEYVNSIMDKAIENEDFETARGMVDTSLQLEGMASMGQGAFIGGMVGSMGGPLGTAMGAIGGAAIAHFFRDEEGQRRKKLEKIAKAELTSVTTALDEIVKTSIEAGTMTVGAAAGFADQVSIGMRAANAIINPDEQKKAINELNARVLQAASAAGQGAADQGTLNQIVQELSDSYNGNVAEVKNAAQAAFNVAQAMKAASKAMYDQMIVTSIFNRAGGAVESFVKSLETGSSRLGGAINKLELSLKNLGMGDASGDLAGLRKEAFSALGQAGIGSGSKVGEAMGRQFDMLAEAQSAVAKLPDAMDSMTFTAGQTDQSVKDQMSQSLINNLGLDPGSEMGKIVQGKIDQLKPEDMRAIRAGSFDFSKFLGETSADLAKLGDGALQALKSLEKHEKVIASLTKKRIVLEEKFLSAQQKALDLQLEAAEIAAKFGGAAVTPEDRKRNALGKMNLSTERLGLGGMGTGSASEIQAMSNAVMARFAMQETQGRVGGAFAGADGLDQDKRKNLIKAQQDLIKVTRDMIKINEESLAIIDKKNQKEREALEAAIKGNMKKFLSDSAAAGATAALATGNADLAKSLFGTEGLAGAFDNIKDMADSGVQSLFGAQLGGAGGLVETSASAALDARGLQDPRMAQLVAGTTPEQEALKQQQRQLAGTLSAIGDNAATMAEMQVQSANINIQQAQVLFKNQMAEGAAGMNKGGIVYASDGINLFKPKGTDTVPAMLTPGEAVVSKRGVSAGNNRAVIRAMNKGEAVGGGAPQIDPRIVNQLVKGLSQFNSELSKNIGRLNNTKINIKLDTTKVDVNLNGGSFLAGLKDELKKELMADVGEKIKELKFNDNGNAEFSPTVL